MKHFFRIISLIFIAIICSFAICACNIFDNPSQAQSSANVAETEDNSNEKFDNYVVTAELVNVRKEPNTKSEIICSYYKNTLIQASKTNNKDWDKIKLSDKSEAYIYSPYISPISDKEIEVYEDYQIVDNNVKYAVISGNDYANLRSMPTTESEVVAVYQKNDTLEVLGTTKNGWYVITHDDVTCYISSEVATELSKYEYDGYNKKVNKGTFDDKNYTLIGSYSTYYSSSSSNRSYNLEKAADNLNNMIIKSGAMFNWCRDMGACGKDDGYKESIEIVNSEYVTGYGGGICQVSSTLCAAVISCDKDFTFIDRNHHAIAQSYIPEDLDATVSYPDCNFIFRNDNPYSVFITTQHDGSTLTINIYKMSNVIV